MLADMRSVIFGLDEDEAPVLEFDFEARRLGLLSRAEPTPLTAATDDAAAGCGLDVVPVRVSFGAGATVAIVWTESDERGSSAARTIAEQLLFAFSLKERWEIAATTRCRHGASGGAYALQDYFSGDAAPVAVPDSTPGLYRKSAVERSRRRREPVRAA